MSRSGTSRWLLAGILLVALAARLAGIGFGLPSLYDPDEGFFVITGLKLLKNQTLNPGWFGHPGTVTIYSIALVELGVIGVGLLTGRFADAAGFGRALYADPSIAVLPARLMIVAFGVAGVLLTYLLARRVADRRVALSAAALVALSPLHISLSQIIRTDIQASAFMLLSILAAAAAAKTGRLRDYLLAGAWVGVACATKWPAAAAMASMVGACAARSLRGGRREARVQGFRLVAGLALAPAVLLLVSPYLLLDLSTVAANIGGEAQTRHLGSTGGGLLHNLLWYVIHPVADTFGWLGLSLIVVGGAVAVLRRQTVAFVVVSAAGAFLLGISSQQLIWARWVVPILPLLAIVLSVGAWALLDRLSNLRLRSAAAIALAAAVLLPMAVRSGGDVRERTTDTRAIASKWMKSHVPPGSTVLLEYLAFDLIGEPWSFRYPLGALGCIDPLAAARGQIGATAVYGVRRSDEIVDIGTVNPARLASCHADFVILTNYDRYLAEKQHFPEQLAAYHRLVRGGRLLFTALPREGEVGGPVVRIVRLAPRQ